MVEENASRIRYTFVEMQVGIPERYYPTLQTATYQVSIIRSGAGVRRNCDAEVAFDAGGVLTGPKSQEVGADNPNVLIKAVVVNGGRWRGMTAERL